MDLEAVDNFWKLPGAAEFTSVGDPDLTNRYCHDLKMVNCCATKSVEDIHQDEVKPLTVFRRDE